MGRGDRGRPTPRPTDDTKALAAEYKKLLLAMLQRREAWQIVDVVNKITDPSALADTAGYASYLTDVQKRELLETEDVAERLRAADRLDRRAPGRDRGQRQDRRRRPLRHGQAQKEFLLRQQLTAIRKELGEGEPDGSDDYRARVEAADLPEKVREAALREVGKLERSSEQSPEGGWIRTWLDTVLDLPWNVTTEDSTDLKSAREILDADHHGLDDVKDRIVEYLAVRARRAQRGMAVVGGRGSGAVMVLAGPPGVGKTSLGESVARALGRKFVRVALGGVRDEAEIRGHRRTYVGALPGRIVRAIGEAGSMNPVVLLDEIDKVGSDYRGDPSCGAARGAGPGAEPHVPRPLPRSGSGPVRRGVPGDGQRHREHPVGAAGPHGAGADRRLHRGRQGRHRPRLPAAPAGRPGGADRRRGARSPTPRCARSPPTTPANRACGSSSGCWPRRCARRRRSSPAASRRR